MNNDFLESLPGEIKTEILRLDGIVWELEYTSFIVGGSVRDWVLGKPIKDIDIVIEGDAEKVAQIYGHRYNIDVDVFSDFKTAKIPIKNKFVLNIDLATARKEIYEYPGALPIVQQGSLYDDLRRRDFTINTLCYSLGTNKIIDLFDGIIDIKERTIKVLHTRSFIDDPTRILRAIRFKTRYHFNYDKSTWEYMKAAISMNSFETISRDRLKKEVYRCLQEKELAGIFLEIQKLRIMKSLFLIQGISFLKIKWLEKAKKYCITEDIILLSLLVIFFNEDKEDINNFCENYQVKKQYRTILLNNQEDFLRIKILFEEERLKPFDIFQCFSSLVPEQILFLRIYIPSIMKYLNFYINELKDEKIKITGKDLHALGINPGPNYKKIFTEVLRNKMNLRWSSKANELEYIKKNIERWR